MALLIGLGGNNLHPCQRRSKFAVPREYCTCHHHVMHTHLHKRTYDTYVELHLSVHLIFLLQLVVYKWRGA